LPDKLGLVYTKTDKNSRGIHASVKLGGKSMPAEITNAEKFVEMSANAKFCAVKRLKGSVKLKLRTPSKLYTLKVEPGNAEETIKKLKCKIQEI
jgi:hypothetical protein